MKTERKTITVTAFLGVFLLSFILNSEKLQAQKPVRKLKDEIIRAELSFAKTAAQKGISAAFLAFLDQEGLVVNGNNIVNGRKLYAAVPADTNELLTWYPQYARINQDGDFGFTSGPYLYYSKKGSPPVASGYYFSIWQKDKSGSYKVKFDGGVNHSEVKETQVKSIKNVISETHQYVNKALNVAPAEKIVMKFETDVKNDILGQYKKHLSTKCLILRPNEKFYTSSKEYLKSQQEIVQKKFSTIPLIAGYDQRHKMFYSCGNLALTEASATKQAYCGYYVRVWQQEKEGWKIVADVQQY